MHGKSPQSDVECTTWQTGSCKLFHYFSINLKEIWYTHVKFSSEQFLFFVYYSKVYIFWSYSRKIYFWPFIYIFNYQMHIIFDNYRVRLICVPITCASWVHRECSASAARVSACDRVRRGTHAIINVGTRYKRPKKSIEGCFRWLPYLKTKTESCEKE